MGFSACYIYLRAGDDVIVGMTDGGLELLRVEVEPCLTFNLFYQTRTAT